MEDARFLRTETKYLTKFTLPGPMTMVDTLYDDHYHSRAKLAAEFAGILTQETREIAAAGIDVIQFDEPAFKGGGGGQAQCPGGRGGACKSKAKLYAGRSLWGGLYLAQHFLYFLPLPHGHGSLRPTFFSAIFVFNGFNNMSKSLVSSGLSGSNSIL